MSTVKKANLQDLGLRADMHKDPLVNAALNIAVETRSLVHAALDIVAAINCNTEAVKVLARAVDELPRAPKLAQLPYAIVAPSPVGMPDEGDEPRSDPQG